MTDSLLALASGLIATRLFFLSRNKAAYDLHQLLLLFALLFACHGLMQAITAIGTWHDIHQLETVAKIATTIASLIAIYGLIKHRSEILKLMALGAVEMTGDNTDEDQVSEKTQEIRHRADSIFKFAIDLLPTALVVVDAAQKIVVTNKSCARIFGYSLEELVGQPLSLLLEEDKRAQHDALVLRYLAAPTQHHLMASGRHVHGRAKSGELINLEISLSAHEFRGEVHAFASIQLVGEILDQNDSSFESSSRIMRAIDATNDGLWEWNVRTNKVWYSATFNRMIGLDPKNDHAKFEDWLDHIHPEDRPLLQEKLARHFQVHAKFDVYYRGRCERGKYKWLHTRGDTIFDADDRPLLMSGTLTDVNEVQSLQQELSDKTHFLNQLLSKSLSGTYIFDLQSHKNTFIDKRFTEILGYTLEDLEAIQQQDGLLKLIHPEDQEAVAHHIEKVITNTDPTGVAIEYRFKHKEGHWIWCYSRDSVYEFNECNEAQTLIGSFFTISELKDREARIKKLAKDFENTFEQAAVGIAHISLEGFWLKANKRLCSILDTSLEELQEQPFDAIMLEIDRDNDAPLMKELRAGERHQYSVEKRLVRKQHDVFWANLTVSLAKEQEGSAGQLIVVIEDITERKAVAQSLAESNASLERFAYSASHDLQEPLRKISAFSDSLDRRLIGRLDDPDARYELNRISDAAKRMRGMIDSLLQLSRFTRRKIDKVSVNLSALLSLAEEDLSKLIGETGAQIQLHEDIELFVDTSAFQQVLRNLISNSIRYAKPDTTPQIDIDVETRGNRIIIIFKDDGKGFHLQYAEQIFEPFKRLVGREIPGSGMGLALCREILKAHGGTISARSCLGEGAQFTIELPI